VVGTSRSKSARRNVVPNISFTHCIINTRIAQSAYHYSCHRTAALSIRQQHTRFHLFRHQGYVRSRSNRGGIALSPKQADPSHRLTASPDSSPTQLQAHRDLDSMYTYLPAILWLCAVLP
jgi:hypothetical protein